MCQSLHKSKQILFLYFCCWSLRLVIRITLFGAFPCLVLGENYPPPYFQKKIKKKRGGGYLCSKCQTRENTKKTFFVLPIRFQIFKIRERGYFLQYIRFYQEICKSRNKKSSLLPLKRYSHLDFFRIEE